MPKDKNLPSTLQRSDSKAKRTFKKTLESAEEQYGKGERASRTAYSQLKQTHEKIGDHWEPKDHKGASDSRSSQSSTNAKQAGKGKTYGGVDVKGSTRDELIDKAKKVGVTGYSNMNKDELGKAIEKANDSKTAKARDNS